VRTPIAHRRTARAAAISGYSVDMSGWDDDDWKGEPPEGRHSASRADPGFWRAARPPLSITAFGLGIALVILLIAWLL